MLGHELPENMSLASVSGRRDNERDEMEEWRKGKEEEGSGEQTTQGGGGEGVEMEGVRSEEGVEQKGSEEGGQQVVSVGEA